MAAMMARLSPNKKVLAAMAVAVNVMVPKHRTTPTAEGPALDKKLSPSAADMVLNNNTAQVVANKQRSRIKEKWSLTAMASGVGNSARLCPLQKR